MELRLYLRMLQRGWWIITITALLALIVALTLDYLATPLYQASARFVVSPSTSYNSGQEAIYSLDTLDKRSIVSTYAEFLNSSRIYNETIKELRLTPQDLKDYTYTTVALPDANILELSVIGSDPKLAATLANDIGQRAIVAIHNLYRVYDISVLDPATIPQLPISPQPLRDGILALVLGIILGSVLAIGREQLLIPLDAYRQKRVIDRVSSAYTRRYFQRRLEIELAKNPKDNLSLGLVQLDGLEDLIDSLPQTVLQKLLSKVSVTLRRELRGNDLIGRWDDIRMAVLLPATGEVPAARTMERIHQALSTPIVIEGEREAIHLRPLVSVVTYQGTETATQLTESAESKLVYRVD